MTVPEQFRRDRIGVVGTVGGAEILPGDWTGALNRITAVERVASAMNPYQLGLGGSRWISPQSHGLGGTRESVAIAPTEIVYTPIFTSEPFSSMAMCVEVVTPQPGAQLRLGIFAANGTLIRDFGTCDASTAGWKVVEVGTPSEIPIGTNLLAIHANNIAGIEIRQLVGGLAMYHSSTSIMVPVHGIRTLRTFGPLPATAPTGGAAQTIPLMGLRLD